MDFVDLALRWMHIFAAIMIVGGTFFLRFVWFPAYREIDYRDRESRFSKLRGAWAKLVMLSTLFLLVSGLVNAVLNIKRYEIDSSYHMLVGIKFLIAMLMFFLSARVAGRSDSAVRFREQIGKWLTINCLLAVILVGIAGWMKLMPREPKLPEPTESGKLPVPVMIQAAATHSVPARMAHRSLSRRNTKPKL